MNITEVSKAFDARDKVEVWVKGNWIEGVITEWCTSRPAYGHANSLKVTVACDNSSSHTVCDVSIADQLRVPSTKATLEERILLLQRERDDSRLACSMAKADRESLIKAIDHLKQQIGEKADALAAMPVNSLTSEVIVRHVAALRRLA